MTLGLSFLSDDVERQISLARSMGQELNRIDSHADPEVQAVKRNLVRLACQLAENATTTARRAAAAIERLPR